MNDYVPSLWKHRALPMWMKSFHMYTIAWLCIYIYICCLYNDSMYRSCSKMLWIACFPTGGLKTPSPITILSERGEDFFRQLWVELFPHYGKEQIKGRKTGASNIRADADRCKQTQKDRQSALLTWFTHWTIIFPSQIYLVGSAKMLDTAYRLKCTPLSREIHCNWPRTIETKQWLSQTIRNRTQVILFSVRHSRLRNWTGD